MQSQRVFSRRWVIVATARDCNELLWLMRRVEELAALSEGDHPIGIAMCLQQWSLVLMNLSHGVEVDRQQSPDR